MPMAFELKHFAGIGRQLFKSEPACGLILRGSVAHDAVTSFRADQHKVSRARFRAALGATGDMNRPGEARPRQQRREPAAIAACVQSGRPTAGSTRARLDLQQRVARFGNQALTLRGVEDALSRLPAGYSSIERAPR